ncbi:MAG: hypothetical protein D6738_12455 [Acidobacteria bacterium]|nr:MAG: hypothetical protein D6738_12455 [Acidobacteriota bacterium]
MGNAAAVPPMTATPTRNAGALARRAGRVAGLLLGLAFALSSWAKAVDPRGFAEEIVRQGLLPDALAHPAALAVIVLEAALAAALILGLRQRPVLGVATALMAFFLGLAAWQLAFPPEDAASCGCFGNVVPQSPVQHVITNAVLFALALASWLGRGPVARARLRGMLAAAVALAALVFALAAPHLPIDGWPGVTLLREGVPLDALPIADAVPEAFEGTWLVLLIDRADEATRAAVPVINERLALVPGETGVVALAEENPELEGEFLWTAGPAFPVHSVPWSMIKPLYRSLPRAFVVRDGRVVRVWNGLPDGDELAALAEGRIP